MHRKIAAAIVAALALGVASCGSSEGPELTKAQLVNRIELACREGRQAGEQFGRTHRELADSALILVGTLLADQQALEDKLGDLNAPAAMDADFDAYKQAVQERVDLFKRINARGRAGANRALTTEQAQGAAITQRIQTALRSLGVEIRDRGCT